MHMRFKKSSLGVISLLLIAVCLLLTCEVDKDYLFFLNADLPDHFSVTISNTDSLSVCDTEGNVQLSITAINEDGTTNIKYSRSLKLFIQDESLKTWNLTPSKSEPCTQGSVIVSGVQFPAAPEGLYTVKVVDEKNRDLTGTSEPFDVQVLYVDHFKVTVPDQAIFPDVPFTCTLEAIDQNGTRFSDFDGYVDLKAANYSITPSFVKLSGGYAAPQITLTGTGEFTIDATLSAQTDATVTCEGGLEVGDGGGGGGDGGGGGTPSEPGTLTCTLTTPTYEVLKNTDFTLYLSVTKQDQNGNSYPGFSGAAGFSSTIGTITPASQTLSTSTYSPYSFSWSDFKIDSTGDGITITAAVTDDDSALTCECTGTITVVDGVAIYGDSAEVLKGYLEAEFSDKSFFVINSTAELSAYTALIVNLASSSYEGQSLGDLTSNQADQIWAFYNTGKPVFLAPGRMTAYVITTLAYPMWGVGSRYKIDLTPPEVGDPISVTLSFNTSSPGAAGPGGSVASVTLFGEFIFDGYPLTGITATQVVNAAVEGTSYALILAKTSGTRAILTGLPLYHPFGGADNTETQWWESNKEMMINLIAWLLGS